MVGKADIFIAPEEQKPLLRWPRIEFLLTHHCRHLFCIVPLRACLSKGRTCKFSGRDCSFSHGIEVPLVDLLPDSKSDHVAGAEQASSREPSGTEQWLATVGAGSRLLARFHDRVWYDATAEGPSVNGRIAVCFTGFEDEGCVFLPADLSHLAPPDDQVDDADGRQGVSGDGASDEEESELEDAWAEEIPEGDDGERGTGTFFRERVLGDRQETAGGGKADGSGSLLTDAYVFGDWEQHTKGFGSRMMSRMGYRRGEGLGKEKQVSSITFSFCSRYTQRSGILRLRGLYSYF